MSIVTEDITNRLLDNMIGINEVRRNFDSSSDERRCLKISKEEIKMYEETFSFNVGRMSDGKLIRLDEKDIYFKIPINISMINSDSEEESYVHRATDRAKEKQSTLQVFIGGLKVPDDKVLFYPTRSNVDVMIPMNYVDRNGTSIIVEKKIYNRQPYIHYYSQRTSEQSFNIKISKEESNQTVIHERTVMIYVDKKLYTGSRSVALVANSVNVSIFQQLDQSEVEIIVDSSVTYFFPSQAYSENIDKCIFEIPESYIDSIHGPISKFSCLFFEDGKRIANNDIEQVGRLHFLYNLSETKKPNLSLYVTDVGDINDLDFILYGCDYYLYNMIGTKAITLPFYGEPSDTIFDDHISFNEVLNKDGVLYSREKINEILKKFNDSANQSSKAAELLKDRPYLMRTFLENYGKEQYTYTVDYNGSDSYVYIGLPDTFEINSERKYMISVNTYYIPSSEIEVIEKDLTDVFKIPSQFFTVGTNTVEIEYVDVLDVEYIIVKPDQIEEDDGYKFFSINSFTRVNSEEDILVFDISRNEEGITYVTDSNVGWKLRKDYTVYIDEKNIIHIIFENEVKDDILIYNKNFTTVYNYIKPLESEVMDIKIPIYAGSSYTPIPYISRGQVYVYAGNNKLMNGIDYFVKTPENEDTVGGTFVIIRRSILPGTQIDIYFSNIKTEHIMDYPGYINNNPYGLFYLGSLKYPVSLKYLNIYINNKKLTESDIDILSDKLIRIHSLPVPMYDLSIETTFTQEDEVLKPFIDLYKEDEFEKYIESLFRGVWLDRPYDPNEEVFDYNEIYESFIETVDSVNKRPNPIAREEEWIPSYNDDPSKEGVYNNGEAMGHEHIFSSQVIDNRYIVSGSKGRVASYYFGNGKWYNFDSGEYLSNSGIAMDFKNIYDSVFYKGYLIFAGEDAHICYVDIEKREWHSYKEKDGISLINPPENYFIGSIRKLLLIEDLLVVLGDNGNVASYSFLENKWHPITDVKSNNIAACSGIMGTIYDAYSVKVLEKYQIVVCGENGEIASCRLDINAWTKPDGSRYIESKVGPSLCNDGSSRNFKDIYRVTDYLNMKVFVGEDGYVSYYNRDKGIFSDYNNEETDSSKLINSGSHSEGRDSYCTITYDSSTIIVGGKEGKISSYLGSKGSWYNSNDNVFISNDGKYMQNCSIFTIDYTFGATNYIIFAGENGKICTYNVDIHEVPYRYDPYKTAFLLWYTTPGVEKVLTSYTLSQEVIKKFSMYKDSADLNYDISIAGGDTDIICDIDMNENGRYPKKLTTRRSFIAEFIRSLPEKRYTIDEVWDLYLNSESKNILYPRDIIPLTVGDFVDGEEDIPLL